MLQTSDSVITHQMVGSANITLNRFDILNIDAAIGARPFNVLQMRATFLMNLHAPIL
jgi:hypothetical protein